MRMASANATKRKQAETTGMPPDTFSSTNHLSLASQTPKLTSSTASPPSSSAKKTTAGGGPVLSPSDYVQDLIDIWKREHDGYSPILDCANQHDRQTVILCNPEFVDIFFELDAWRRSKLRALYLLAESDEVLQKAIGSVVKKCEGKLFLRIFSRQLPLPDFEHVPLGGWTHVLLSDDKSLPLRRILVIAFRLGKMTPSERDEFLNSARHHFADLILIERVPDKGSDGTRLSLGGWATLLRSRGGFPNEKAAIFSSDSKCFILTTRFLPQGDGRDA